MGSSAIRIRKKPQRVRERVSEEEWRLRCELAAAQNYPNRSIRVIIPFTVGGAADVVFRMLTPPLPELLIQ